jgi:hypothetical protein
MDTRLVIMNESVPASKLKQPDPDLGVFLQISAALTGYSEVKLESTGMLDDYFCVLMKEQDHEGVRAFLAKAKQILPPNADVIKNIKKAFIDLPNTATRTNTPFDQMSYNGLAQRIILLWYTGIWTTMNWKGTKSQDDRTAVVSAQAYQEGLIWETAGTHPSGAKQPGFGSWHEPPIGKPDNRKRKFATRH